jgi:hypothetical protein
LTATRAALRRLKEKGEIADPHCGCHVIVPPEYRERLPRGHEVGHIERSVRESTRR